MLMIQDQHTGSSSGIGKETALTLAKGRVLKSQADKEKLPLSCLIRQLADYVEEKWIRSLASGDCIPMPWIDHVISCYCFSNLSFCIFFSLPTRYRHIFSFF
jgi:hypothetical protein